MESALVSGESDSKKKPINKSNRKCKGISSKVFNMDILNIKR